MFGIDDAIAQVAKLADDAVARIWPDATEVEKAKLSQLSAELQNQYNQVLQQLKINEAEASNPSVFVAGARPAVMWVGVASLSYSSLVQPILAWVAVLFGLPVPPIPSVEVLTTILYGLLGIGGLRSLDKYNGTDTKGLK